MTEPVQFVDFMEAETLEYGLEIGRAGNAWVLRFPDFPTFAVVTERLNELLERASTYVAMAVGNEWMRSGRVPAPAARCDLYIALSDEMLRQFRLAAYMNHFAKHEPRRLDVLTFLEGDYEGDFFDAVTEFGDEGVIQTFRDLGVPVHVRRDEYRILILQRDADHLRVAAAGALYDWLSRDFPRA